MIDLTITNKAHAKINEFRTTKPKYNGMALRIYIAAHICSGPQYGLAFDNAKDDDLSFTSKNLQIVVDPLTYDAIKGSTLDFINDKGFKFDNPNSAKSCPSKSKCGT